MLSRFFAWWGRELAGLLPSRWRHGRRRRVKTLCFTVGRDEVAVSQRLERGDQELGRMPRAASRDGGAAGGEALRGLLAGFKPESTRCVVVLEEGLGLSKPLELPLAAEENLREVLGFEMDRQTPFRVQDVYYDYAVGARDRKSRTLEVVLHVAPRRVVDEALSVLEGWDLRVEEGAEAPRGTTGRIELRFVSSRFRQVSGAGFNGALVAVNLVLLSAVLASPLLQQQRYLNELQTDLRRVRSDAAEAVQVNERIETLSRVQQFLQSAVTDRPSMVELLEELTVLLPDSTWLFRLEVREDEIHLQGASRAAPALIAALEASERLDAVRFGSPVTREGSTGMERFHLIAGIASGKPGGEAPAGGGPE